MLGLSIGITAASAGAGITNALGRLITFARPGETVYAFLPTVGNPPTTVPRVVWTFGALTHEGTSFTLPEGVTGTLSWSGTDSLGRAVSSAKDVEVREAPEPVANPFAVSPPTISGTARAEETLTIASGKWFGATQVVRTLERQPELSGNWETRGPVGNAYVVTAADEGHRLRVREVADGRIETAAVSAATEVVEAAPTGPVNHALPMLSGTPRVGETLTVAPGDWSRVASLSHSLQRRRDGGSWEHVGEVETSLVVAAAEEGHALRLREVPDGREDLAVVSAATAVVAAAETGTPTEPPAEPPVEPPAEPPAEPPTEPPADDTVVFGADTPVGAGGIAVTASEGSYGEFAVAAGVATPVVSPLTVGPATIGETRIEVRREADRDITIASEDELVALEPHTLSTAATPDVTLRLRPGASLSPETTSLFGSGWPRPNPVLLHGMVRLRFEMAADGTRTELARWRAQGCTAADGVDPARAGFEIAGCAFVPETADDAATQILMQNLAGTSFAVTDVRFRGFTALEPYGDYGAKMGYANLSGSFEVGEKIANDAWDARGERTILEVRDNGDGSGTLVLHDGTQFSQGANRARQAAQDSTITGTRSGATATIARAAYDDLPATPSAIGVNGNPRPDHVTVRGCHFSDLSDVVTVKANASVLLEDNTIERYLKDAFTVSPNLTNDSNNTVSPTVTIRGNRVRNPISLASDLGNPHSDGLQINDHSSGRPWGPLVLEFNQFMDGRSRGAAQQMFLQGAPAFSAATIRANIVSGKGSVNSLVGVGDADSLVHNNTLFREMRDDETPYPEFNSPQISMDGAARYVFNVATQAANRGNGATEERNHFVKLDGVTGSDPFTSFAAGPFHVGDWDEQHAAAQAASGADPRAGACGTPVDWAARVVDETHLAEVRDTTPVPPADPDAPAIVFSMSQSEPVYATESDGPRRLLAPPQLVAENFTLYQAENGKANVGPVLKTTLSSANIDRVNPAMVALANALAHAAPGKPFVLSEAGEPGTGRTELADDSDDATARAWPNTEMMYDAVLADYPQGFDRMTEYWYANDSGSMDRWLESFAPYYFGQDAGGAAFTLGEVHAPIGRAVDHCVYDFETTDPSDRGRGLIPRTVPFDMMRKPPWSNDTAARWAGIDAFVADDRFRALGGLYGPPAAAWWSDGAHPIVDDADGVFEAAYDFFMPSMLRAAGLPADESAFTGISVAPDGAFADVTFAPANGGVLSTKRMVRGLGMIAGDLAQEIYGFEVVRASGGGRFAFAVAGAAGIDPKYHATVVRRDDTTVRITPVEPFANGDEISFMRGRAFWRDDYLPNNWDYQADPAKLVLSLPVEHVAAYTDPEAAHPFSGFPVRTSGAGWTVSGLATDGTGGDGGGGGGGSTAAFAVDATGPYFVDPANVPADTTRIRHRFRMRVPATVATVSGSRFVISQESTGFDIRLSTAAGATNLILGKIETGDGSTVTPSNKTLWTGTRDAWVEVEVYADQAAGEVGVSIDGGPTTTRAFTGVSTGVFQSNREISYFAMTSGSSLLQAGVEIDWIETFFTTGGTETLRKRLTAEEMAATDPADPWRRTLTV